MLPAYSQDSKPNPFVEKIKSSQPATILDAKTKKNLPERVEKNLIELNERFELMKSVQINIYKAPAEVKETYRFDLIESLNSNVKFGGFYNGSVNIQFLPAMYIKPFDFLSIYANHQKNLFIPMQSLRENAVQLAVETTGMVVIENAIRFLAPENKIVKGLAEFTLKNCVSLLAYSIFNSSSNSSGESNGGVYKYDFYFLSAGITF